MKKKLLLFAMTSIILASSCTTKSKRITRAYEKGKAEGINIANNKAYEKIHRAMDSVQMETAIIVHDTVFREVKVEVRKKPTDTPTKDYVFKADFKPANFIGYPELGGKFYRVSPIYIDSVLVPQDPPGKSFYKKTERTLTMYIPIDDYNAIKRKKGNVTIYASWMKLSATEMLDFDSKKEGVPVLAGTNYSDVGVKIDFKPATIMSSQPEEPSSTAATPTGKIDPKTVAEFTPCPNPPKCYLMDRDLDEKTCQCVEKKKDK
ncbi:MAG: hypothetical protein KBB86_00680 [Candidatus Pacebacteria bacterium]|nr:hypothetical protein [Candidatus Paceibacterota bacterium]